MFTTSKCSYCAATNVAFFTCNKPPHLPPYGSHCDLVFCKPCHELFDATFSLCPGTSYVCLCSELACIPDENKNSPPPLMCDCGRSVCYHCFPVYTFDGVCQPCKDTSAFYQARPLAQCAQVAAPNLGQSSSYQTSVLELGWGSHGTEAMMPEHEIEDLEKLVYFIKNLVEEHGLVVTSNLDANGKPIVDDDDLPVYDSEEEVDPSRPPPRTASGFLAWFLDFEKEAREQFGGDAEYMANVEALRPLFAPSTLTTVTAPSTSTAVTTPPTSTAVTTPPTSTTVTTPPTSTTVTVTASSPAWVQDIINAMSYLNLDSDTFGLTDMMAAWKI